MPAFFLDVLQGGVRGGARGGALIGDGLAFGVRQVVQPLVAPVPNLVVHLGEDAEPCHVHLLAGLESLLHLPVEVNLLVGKLQELAVFLRPSLRQLAVLLQGVHQVGVDVLRFDRRLLTLRSLLLWSPFVHLLGLALLTELLVTAVAA